MMTFLVLAYGFVASFVLVSFSRNEREQRPHTPILTYAGHGLMAASAAGGVLAIGSALFVAFGASLPALGGMLG